MPMSVTASVAGTALVLTFVLLFGHNHLKDLLSGLFGLGLAVAVTLAVAITIASSVPATAHFPSSFSRCRVLGMYSTLFSTGLSSPLGSCLTSCKSRPVFLPEWVPTINFLNSLYFRPYYCTPTSHAASRAYQVQLYFPAKSTSDLRF